MATMICTILTVQWVYTHWLSYSAYAWQNETGEVVHRSYFPNIQTFALTQVGYEITIREAELIHVTLESEYARQKTIIHKED